MANPQSVSSERRGQRKCRLTDVARTLGRHRGLGRDRRGRNRRRRLWFVRVRPRAVRHADSPRSELPAAVDKGAKPKRTTCRGVLLAPDRGLVGLVLRRLGLVAAILQEPDPSLLEKVGGRLERVGFVEKVGRPVRKLWIWHGRQPCAASRIPPGHRLRSFGDTLRTLRRTSGCRFAIWSANAPPRSSTLIRTVECVGVAISGATLSLALPRPFVAVTGTSSNASRSFRAEWGSRLARLRRRRSVRRRSGARTDSTQSRKSGTKSVQQSVEEGNPGRERPSSGEASEHISACSENITNYRFRNAKSYWHPVWRQEPLPLHFEKEKIGGRGERRKSPTAERNVQNSNLSRRTLVLDSILQGSKRVRVRGMRLTSSGGRRRVRVTLLRYVRAQSRRLGPVGRGIHR